MDLIGYTITGGNMAVVARGSTGCSMVWSSSQSAEILELDLNLLGVVFCVSALCSVLVKREDMLPLFLAEDYCNISATCYTIPNTA